MIESKPPRGAPLRRSHPITRGLIGFWPLNEGGGTQVRDACCRKPGNVVNGSNSIWQNTGLGPGLNWWAGGFEGLDIQDVSGNMGVDSDSDMTLRVRVIIETLPSPSTNGVLMILNSSNSIDISIRPDTAAQFTCTLWGGSEIFTGVDVTLGLHDIVFTHQGSTNRFYVDGILREQNTTALQSGSTNRLTLGNYYPAYAQPFVDGTILCAAMWKRPLNYQEVELLWTDPYVCLARRRATKFVRSAGPWPHFLRRSNTLSGGLASGGYL